MLLVSVENARNASLPGCTSVLEKSIEEVFTRAGVPVFNRKVVIPKSRKLCDKALVVGS